MQDSPFKDLVMWLVLGIAYYAFAVAMGVRGIADFNEYMFGGFRDYWAMHGDLFTPRWNNPFVIMAAVLLVIIVKLRGLLRATRPIAAFIAGIFLVRLVVFALDLYPVPMSFGYAALGVGSLIWYVATVVLVGNNWEELLERLRTD